MNLRLPSSHSRIVSSLATRRGVALVITLILLAVISTLAIAFLGLTQRETSSVDSMGRTTDSEVAADSALERAKAEITAVYPIRNQNAATNGPNKMGPDMMVSVCCQDYDFANRRTIPYDRLDSARRLANLYDSAPPVFVQTNPVVGAASPLDDRFFLDLNRNGIFEDTGYIPDTTDISAGGPGRFQNDVQGGNIVTNWRVGDLQWIGVLQNPRRPHTNNNRFIGRYAYLVLPAGRSLDLNWIHNDSKRDVEPGVGEAWFTREQGLGGFEVNLAAFLTDLNGNTWGGYLFQPSTFPNLPSTGVAFADGWQFVRARYDGAKTSPDRTISALFQPFPVSMTQDLIDREGFDLFARGLGNYTGTEAGVSPWPASDSPRHMFSVHDLFNANTLPKIPAAAALAGFSERLRDTSLPGNSYDRYTFYRMLAQMGTDSIAEDDEEEGKIHLNYVNIRSWSNPSFRYRAQDLVSWTNANPGFVATMGRKGPELFFLSVVTNLLMREFPLSALVDTNTSSVGWKDAPLRIPIYDNGTRFAHNSGVMIGPLYSARIHQILQQAANIYDAVRTSDGSFSYPTVFRPQFRTDLRNPGDVCIVNYVMVDEITDPPSNMMFPANPARSWVDLDAGGRPGLDNGVYNIPLIIGARKGFPNFNEFHSRLVAKAVRRLMVEKPANQDTLANARIFEDFSLFVTNQHSFEAWNSYSSRYTNNLFLYYSNQVTVGIRGMVANAPIAIPPVFTGTNFFPPVYAGTWPSNTFVTPPIATHLVVSHTNYALADAGGFTNQWDIVVTNRIRFFLVDNNRIVGAVALSLTNGVFDIGNDLVEDDTLAGVNQISPLLSLWNRNKDGNWTRGVQSQLRISREPTATGTTEWKDFGEFVPSKLGGIRAFTNFIALRTNVVTSMQVPYTAVRLMIQTNTWSVNDPLVHCNPDDLDRAFAAATVRPGQIPQVGNSLGKVNLTYKPWGGADPDNLLPGDMDPSLKDPGMSRSDYWNFPASKFPTIGWLGRVHRGTPWQTIYLKSDRIGGSVADWRRIAGVKPAGSGISSRGVLYADSIHPTNDWRLLDIFTTAIHPNVTRGRLSINQTNLAAWSAVLSGVTASAITNQSVGGVDVSVPVPSIIDPAWFTNTVSVILDGLNATRGNRPNREFIKLSDIMAVPQLTYESPILLAHGFNSRQPSGNVDVDDSDYERLPEQILGLLKVGEPRFVIYAWGQSLKPARLGFVAIDQPLSGPSIDPDTKLVNNYQVTGEVATRAVVRAVFPERESNNPADAGYFRPDYRRPRLVVESFNIIPLE